MSYRTEPKHIAQHGFALGAFMSMILVATVGTVLLKADFKKVAREMDEKAAQAVMKEAKSQVLAYAANENGLQQCGTGSTLKGEQISSCFGSLPCPWKWDRDEPMAECSSTYSGVVWGRFPVHDPDMKGKLNKTGKVLTLRVPSAWVKQNEELPARAWGKDVLRTQPNTAVILPNQLLAQMELVDQQTLQTMTARNGATLQQENGSTPTDTKRTYSLGISLEEWRKRTEAPVAALMAACLPELLNRSDTAPAIDQQQDWQPVNALSFSAGGDTEGPRQDGVLTPSRADSKIRQRCLSELNSQPNQGVSVLQGWKDRALWFGLDNMDYNTKGKTIRIKLKSNGQVYQNIGLAFLFKGFTTTGNPSPALSPRVQLSQLVTREPSGYLLTWPTPEERRLKNVSERLCFFRTGILGSTQTTPTCDAACMKKPICVD